MTARLCQECGAELVKPTRQQKFCSRKCQRQARNKRVQSHFDWQIEAYYESRKSRPGSHPQAPPFGGLAFRKHFSRKEAKQKEKAAHAAKASREAGNRRKLTDELLALNTILTEKLQ